MTNFERLKQMSVREMAEFIDLLLYGDHCRNYCTFYNIKSNFCVNNNSDDYEFHNRDKVCEDGIHKWLESEAEE